jgi:hypothetical protein
MQTERLKFKLELYGTYWDKPPFAEILINGQSQIKLEITGALQKPNIIEFEKEFTEGETGTLTILRSLKDHKQTKLNAKGEIEKDQLLHIKSIEIDEIDIGSLVYEGVYEPDYPEPWYSQQVKAGTILPKTFTNVTRMGHNGSWTLKFQSPFYMWLLENLY